LLPAWAVDEVIEHGPERCDCRHVFCARERVEAGEPARHRVEELPVARGPRAASRSRADRSAGRTLRRDVAFHADGLAAEQELGDHGLRVCEQAVLDVLGSWASIATAGWI
jgi:hypothetical protein